MEDGVQHGSVGPGVSGRARLSGLPQEAAESDERREAAQRQAVVRAEASRMAGEERPVLSLASSERAQPQIPRRAIRYICCLRWPDTQ